MSKEKNVRVRAYRRPHRGDRVKTHRRSKPWRKRKRTIEKLQEEKRKGKKKASREEIERIYKRNGYENVGLGAAHGADEQFYKQHKDGTQDHARIYEKKEKIEVEEHTDLVSPEKDPAGHLLVDVGEVTYAREIEGKNENRTKRVAFRKKK